MLSSAPKWTGIGSLPDDGPEAALERVLRDYASLPFIPQWADPDSDFLGDALPELARHPHPGFGARLLGIGAEREVEAAFEASPEALGRCGCLRSLDQMLQGLPVLDEGLELKFQLPGPASLLHLVRDGGGNPLVVYPELRERVVAWHRGLVSEAAKRLLEHHEPITLWLDEPVLGLLDVDAAEIAELLTPSLEALRDLELRSGIHCCSEPPMDLLALVSVDDFSFDLLRYSAVATAASSALASFLRARGRLALGVVAPGAEEDEDAEPLIQMHLRQLAEAGFVCDADAILLTPSCGTRLVPPEREAALAAELARLSSALEPFLDSLADKEPRS